MKRNVVVIYLLLIAANVLSWIWAYLAFRGNSVLMGAAVLAYTFGLRHAFDADHIAAIDNVTRKFMQLNRKPLTIGLFFSLGHSAVVLLATIAIGFTLAHINKDFLTANDLAGKVGTIISATFLLLMAAVNCIIAFSAFRTFMNVRCGGTYSDEDFDVLLNGRGFLSRIFRPLFGFISQTWHMFFIGFLFGLGFDTATEIGLLSIVGTQAAQGLSPWSLLAFPALFAASMSLADTTDGVLMTGAYGWAFLKPIRKIYYNLTITLVSVIVALLVAAIEVFALLGQEYNLQGSFFTAVGSVNDSFSLFGAGIVGLFLLSWGLSAFIYWYNDYDAIKLTE